MNTTSVALTIMLGVATSAVSDESLESASQYVARGMQRFRDNEIADSIRDYQQAAKLDPRRAPRLWQLGISQYYVGQFDAGRRQFESHQTVNPNDVENAAWHFLCVARIEGVQAARKSLIRMDTTRDRRVPMSQIYEFYAGRRPEIAVLRAAEGADTEVARMYAHLYLGLYYEVAGKPDQARAYMRKAAVADLTRHTMRDVAKIHLLRRKWKR